jgi:SAM-dependent methyltransferase
MLERALTSLRLRALDARDRLEPGRDPLVPPRRLQFVGHGDFAETGDEFLAHFTDLAGLRSSDRVLDIGSGIGRMARPLTRVLDPARGSYEGFDVNRDGIGWCRRRYRRHPNFNFRVADLYNRRYHPGGAQKASEYRFPYDDRSFDLVIATSVFTHLLEEEAEHYVAESARVLVPGGRLFATFFLLDDASRAQIAAGNAGLPFLDPAQHVAVLSEDLPEEAVAYDRGWVGDRLAAHGLKPAEPRPGTWSGRDDGLSFQDIVVATREEPVDA